MSNIPQYDYHVGHASTTPTSVVAGGGALVRRATARATARKLKVARKDAQDTNLRSASDASSPGRHGLSLVIDRR